MPPKRRMSSVCLAMLILAATVSALVGQQQTRAGSEAPFTCLFDTGVSASAPRSGESLSGRSAWTRLPEDQTTHEFKGDAVFMNNKLAIVLRRNTTGAEIYSRRGDNVKSRAVLVPIGEGGPARLSSVRIVENNSSIVAVEGVFQTTDGQALILRYQLQVGQPFIKTESRQGVRQLCVEAPCRFAVLPDFFADDIVVDADKIPVSRAELPSENFVVQMLDDGEAILMSVWDERDQDVRITLSGQSEARIINSSEIYYGKKGSIWVAVMEDRRIWHVRSIAQDDAGKIVRLDWTRPYSAQWRVDWRRDDGLTDSWEMLSQNPNGEYVKHGWFGQPESFGAVDWMKPDRERWTTVLGRFQYPCWLDQSGQGYVQPLERRLRFQGPAIIYPINRLKDTPIDRFTVVDIVRETLGVGPCEYILDVEGQQKEFRGIATCAARDKLNAIYGNKQQRRRRPEVEKALVDVLAFVRHIRARIEDYVAFGRETFSYLAQQKEAHPELAEPLAEMQTITRTIEQYLAKRKTQIKTPEYATDLVEQFRTNLVDYEGDDALERCKKITAGLVEIGGNQDELVGECRMVVKILRQRAGLLMAVDPRTTDICSQIRQRTRQMLREPTSYEAPRH